MQLTQYTDYSLRVLAYLAEVRDGATIGEVSEYFGISRNHLVKAVHNLSSKGFLVGTRGKGGGIRLARPAEQIRLGDVVRATEPNFAIVECFNPERSCVLSAQCGLQSPLQEALLAFLAVLDRHTLADAHLATGWQPIRVVPRNAA
jgi:Rrf2 family nitric oxide-sensitive transcriptional repressor